MDEGEREPYDYEAAVVAILTLRINTPGAEWLSDHDHEVFGTYQKEAVEADEEEWASEYMLLTMMNTAWLALVYLAGLTGESESMAPADRDGPSRSASARRRGELGCTTATNVRASYSTRGLAGFLRWCADPERTKIASRRTSLWV